MLRCRALAGLTLVPLLAAGAGCGDDDGADVRELGSADESGSAAASGSASASGSAAASGSASAATAACEPVGDASTADRELAVSLDEWSIEPEAPSIAAGAVTFTADNVGEEAHELVVVRGDDPSALPVEEGKVQEDQLAEGAFIGEIEAFPAGEQCQGTFELAAGDYILLCNIVEELPDGSLESHFEMGMVTTLTVT